MFAFGTALLESTPLPDHYKPILPAGLAGVSVGLGLKDRTLLDWMSDDLTADAKASLVALLQSLSKLPNWLVIYEAGAGSGRRTVECANGLFDCISSAITDASGYDVTVIVPGS